MSEHAPYTGPPLQSQCLKLFGNPFSRNFDMRNIIHIAPPFQMFMGTLHIPSIAINKIAAHPLANALEDIADYCGHNPEQIAKIHANRFSGSLAKRTMRGSNAISMHAYGLAVDFDAEDNQLGAPETETFFKHDSVLVKIFIKHGWIWGGDWRNRRDSMHFQYGLVG